MNASAEPSIALDNDVVLKAVCFRLDSDFWQPGTALGVLGAARFVLARAVTRPQVSGDAAELNGALADFFDRAAVFEPTETELALAANLVLLAQEHELELDTGEAQLAAIVVERGIEVIDTGDKRAIAALERELDLEPRIAGLAGRVRCLEQLVFGVLDDDLFERVRTGVCEEAGLDKALSICFSCASDREITIQDARDGLDSYIRNLRRSASRMLAS